MSRVLALVSSAADARAIMHVSSELRARGVAMRHVALDGPGIELVLAAVNGATCRIIGRDAPLNAARLLREEHPDAVILGADNLFFHQRLVVEARRHGVATVLVQEAANELVPVVTVRKGLRSLASQPRRAWMRTRLMLAHGQVMSLARIAFDTALDRPRRAIGYGFGGVDTFCVADEAVRETYQQRGCNARHVVATGIPGLIPAIPLREPDFDVVILTQPLDAGGFAPPGWTRGFFASLVQALRDAFPSIRILCKTHPTESPAEYADIGADTFTGCLTDAIARSKIAISIHSAALAAALASGRPAVACVPKWLRESTDNMIIDQCRRLGLLAEDAATLVPIVKQLLDSTSALPEPRPFSLCTDGLAAGRIADQIELAIAARRPPLATTA